MKRITRLMFAAALAAGAFAAQAQDKTFEWKYSHWVPPTHPLHGILLEWAKSIDAASKELQKAMDDYVRMRDSLTSWYRDLRDLDRRYHEDQDEQDESLDTIEQELKRMIERCETTMAEEQAAVQLTPPVRSEFSLQGPGNAMPVSNEVVLPVEGETLAPIVEARQP